MSEFPDDVAAAFEDHDAFERSESGFELTTTAFAGVVTTGDRSGEADEFLVRVRVPTLDATTTDEVGDVVVVDWFETLERRLSDADKATRQPVELSGVSVRRVDDAVEIEYRFEWADPGEAAAIAKTLVEYVEGTYVEGIVPGYEYVSPVADLLAGASHSDHGGTPL